MIAMRRGSHRVSVMYFAAVGPRGVRAGGTHNVLIAALGQLR